MPVKQGDLELLQHPASLALLKSTIPARLAYVWTDGAPRVVPIWFHWNEREFVLASPPKAASSHGQPIYSDSLSREISLSSSPT